MGSSQTRSGANGATTFRLSPSDFAFQYEECKRCFYCKVRYGFCRPFGLMPKVFTNIDGGMKACFDGKPLPGEWGLPAGDIRFSDRWVESSPILLPGHTAACTIRGKFDTVAQLPDGSYAVLDYKTSSVRDPHIRLYARQLHAYAYALEHPAPGQFGLSPITLLGLIVFEPNRFGLVRDRRAALLGGLSWLEVERDDAGFLAFLDEVLTLLEQPVAPPPSPDCGYCRYLEGGSQLG